MRVRPAIEGDEAAIVAMAAHAVPETFPHLTFSPARTRAAFRQALIDHMPLYYLTETDAQQPIGFQVVLWGNSSFSTGVGVEQKVIYVRPEFRGSNAAAAMLDNLQRFARSLGADELYVNVGSGNRQQAAARYIRRFGFDEVGSVLRKVGLR